MGAVKTLLTFAEFERMESEEPGKTELLEGELIQFPPSKKAHSKSSQRLFLKLDAQMNSRGYANPDSALGEAWKGIGYILGTDPGWWLIPDVSITWANQPGSDYLEGAPMFAFEIVSKSNRPAHIARKRKKYLECGAAEVWVFYPETLHAMVFTQSGERREDAAFRSELLPGVDIPFPDFL